jgi:hypothetical protein
VLQLEAMQQLGVGVGLDEGTITKFVSKDRGTRAASDLGSPRSATSVGVLVRSAFDDDPKDLYEAALAGAERENVMPMAAVAAQSLPTKLKEGDRLLDELGPLPAIPRRSSCDQELAAPYRQSGFHPECGATFLELLCER